MLRHNTYQSTWSRGDLEINVNILLIIPTGANGKHDIEKGNGSHTRT